METTKTLEKKLKETFHPVYLDIINESHLHGGNQEESHFRVILVSDLFKGLSLIKRHQDVYKSVNDLLKEKIHALSLRIYSEEEWKKEVDPLKSPPCARKER